MTGEITDFGEPVDADGEWADFRVDVPKNGWAELLEILGFQEAVPLTDEKNANSPVQGEKDT